MSEKLKPVPQDKFAMALWNQGIKTWYLVETKKPEETLSGKIVYTDVRLQIWIKPDGSMIVREYGSMKTY